MHFNRKFSRCAALALMGLVSSTANGITWNGAGANGNFSTGGNWLGGAAPGTTEDAQFVSNTAARSDVTLDSTRSVRNITVTGTNTAGSIQFLQANTLTFTDKFAIGANTPLRLTTGAALTGAATGSMTMASGSTLNIQTGGSLTTRQFTNGGGAVNLAGSGTFDLEGSGTFASGATLNVTTGALVIGNGGALILNNSFGTFANSYAINNGATVQVIGGGSLNIGTFLDIGNPGAGTLLVNGANSRVTAASINTFSVWGGTGGTATVTFANGGAGTFNAGLRIATTGGSATVNLNAGQLNSASLLMGGGAGSANVNITDGGTLNVTGFATFANNTAVHLNYATNPGLMRVDLVLQMSGNAKIQDDSTAAVSNAAVRAGRLDMFETSRVDLFTAGLIVQNATPFTTMKNYITTAYHNGDWLGSMGITTSAGAQDFSTNAVHKRGIGYSTAGDLGLSTFKGIPVAGTDTIVRMTYYGDANLDGRVNALDFNSLAKNFGGSSKNWIDGDFNYNGTVNAQDFTLLGANFNQSAEPAPVLGNPLGALIPEPCSLAFLGVCWGLLHRRRFRATRQG